MLDRDGSGRAEAPSHSTSDINELLDANIHKQSLHQPTAAVQPMGERPALTNAS
jgi:hypothetical protein